MRDEKEGPVTKSIRLTASLILKNLVIYSSLGRSWVSYQARNHENNVICNYRRLRAYESHLSTVALSNVESSRTVSQILFEMANATEIVWICHLLIFSWNVSVDCDLIYFYTKKHYTWPRRIVNQEHPQISNCRVNECDYLFSVLQEIFSWLTKL